jgi:hypothetical protein
MSLNSPLLNFIIAWLPSKRSGVWPIMMCCAVCSILNAFMGALALTPLTISKGYLWVLFSTGFVLPPQGPFMLIIILGFLAYHLSGMARGAPFRPPAFIESLILFCALFLISLFFPSGLFWGWMMEGVMLVWFGCPLERRRGWGREKFMVFSATILFITYTLMGLILWIKTSDLTAHHSSHASGLNPLSKGLILTWGHSLGTRKIEILNIKGTTLKWIVLAFGLFECLLISVELGLSSMIGASIAWILIDELWRPARAKFLIRVSIGRLKSFYRNRS